jgi:hypothetical protein
MILQQKPSNAVWGFSEPGEKVTVKSSWGSEARAVADKSGRWKILLKPPGHGTGYRLTVQGKNTLTARNVANPLFPALRPGPTTAPGASLQKQIPSSLRSNK